MLKLIEGFYLGKAEPESGGGGSAPVIEELNVTPTTSAQVITAPSGTDGYNPVNVSAVTSSIDENIISANIINGVTILGVTGSATELNGTTLSITPTTSAQTITPTSPNNGFTEIDVAAVTSSIDANIIAGNIKNGIEILGVTGTLSSGEKYGATIDMFIGDVTEQGVLNQKYYPQTINLVFDGVKRINKDSICFTRMPNNFNVEFPDLEELGQEALFKTFAESKIKNAVFTKLTTVDQYYSLNSAFYHSSIESVSFPELVTINDSSGFSCERMCESDISFLLGKLTSVSFPKLATISGQRACGSMLQYQKLLTTFPFNKVETITGTNAMSYAMQYCSNTEINFEELTTINGNTALAAFNYGNTALTKVYFPKLNSISGTDVFGASYSGMLYNCTNCTEIHFKSDMQSTISAITGYANKWGATNATIYFDL